MMPKISVIIPSYNAEKFIDQCITSVLQQSLRDIEVICVDDGSGDNTVAILKKYESKDTRLKVLCQQNKFAGVARNTGMEVATGEYFAFLDADDYYEADSLEKAYCIAKENNLDMLKLSTRLLDHITGEISTNVYYSNSRFGKKEQTVSYTDVLPDLLNCTDAPWNGLYRAAFIRKNGIRFNNFRCVNDHSFYIWCVVKAERIMVTDQFLTCYRRNIPGSLVSIRYQHFEYQIDSYHLVKRILSDTTLTEEEKQLVLSLELSHIFNWYRKFANSGINVYYIENIIRDFLAEYNENDIGEENLQKNPWKLEYYRFKKSLEICWQQEEPAEKPLVSVIVPVHNSVAYLSECIESILLQTLTDFEIVCVNDGSTDASEDLLRCMAQRDNRIRVLSQSQSGAGVARNFAIRKARGNYLFFLDSDDIIKREYLYELYSVAEKHKADVVISPQILWYPNGREEIMCNRIAEKHIPQNRVFSRKDTPDYILGFSDGGPGGKLFRREFILQHNLQFLTIQRSEDFCFVLGAFLLAERIVYHTNSGYLYRQNSQSLENTKDETPLLFWEATLLFKKWLRDHGFLEEFWRAYLNNALGRFVVNLKGVKNYVSFSTIFYQMKKIQFTELELDVRDENFFFEEYRYRYHFVKKLLSYETPESFLYNEYFKLDKEYQKIKTELGEIRQENSGLKTSASYRIGCLITWIPRKILGFGQCIRDHGLLYTVRYFCYKGKLLFTRKYKD